MEKKYPVELTELSNPIESYIVGLFWKYPELYFDYDDDKINKYTFVSDVWRFYFFLGKYLKVNEGKTILDDIAVELGLDKFNSKWKEKYEKYGGYEIIQELLPEVNINNFDGYYNELKKWELLRKLYDKDFPVLKNIEKFKKMQTQQIIDYFDYQLNEAFINSDIETKVYNLCSDLDKHIEEADKKPAVGLPLYNMNLLNGLFQGLGRGCVYQFGLHSGKGKTRFACSAILMSALKKGEKTTIIANEQGIKDFRNILLTTVLKYEFNYDFDSQRWLQGKFTETEKQMLNKAKQYLKYAEEKEIISFVPLVKYQMNLVKKIIKKQVFRGHNYFIFDTFKNEVGNDKDWKTFMDSAHELDDIAKPVENGGLNINIFTTMQLTKGSINKRYLDEGDVGISKNVIDIATVQFMGRKIREDERSYGKHPLQVWNYDKQGNKIDIMLDDNKIYYIFWVTKNRRGMTDPWQIVVETDLAVNYWKEMGITKIPRDD